MHVIKDPLKMVKKLVAAKEPFIILRAKDNGIVSALAEYQIYLEEKGCSDEYKEDIKEMYQDILNWRAKNRVKCKKPD